MSRGLGPLQKSILGWLYVYEKYPDALRWNDWMGKHIGLRALRAKVVKPYRRKLRITNPHYIDPNQHYFYKYEARGSVSFSRAVRTLQFRGLVICTPHETPGTREQWVKRGRPRMTSKPFKRSYWGKVKAYMVSRQYITIKLAEGAADIAKKNLTMAMK